MKKSLGKGLDALFGEEIEEKIENIEGKNASTGITELKITEIEPNTKQPRKMFDQEKIDSLAESIKENGIMQPIVVSKAGDTYHTQQPPYAHAAFRPKDFPHHEFPDHEGRS